MGIKYLTDEWAEAFTAALNADEAFHKEAGERRSTVAWLVSDLPGGGQVEYSLRIEGGDARVALGPPVEPPDLQLTCTYEVLRGLATNELSGREAFVGKRLKSNVRLIRILRYIGLFREMNRVMSGLEIEF